MIPLISDDTQPMAPGLGFRPPPDSTGALPGRNGFPWRPSSASPRAASSRRWSTRHAMKTPTLLRVMLLTLGDQVRETFIRQLETHYAGIEVGLPADARAGPVAGFTKGAICGKIYLDFIGRENNA